MEFGDVPSQVGVDGGGWVGWKPKVFLGKGTCPRHIRMTPAVQHTLTYTFTYFFIMLLLWGLSMKPTCMMLFLFFLGGGVTGKSAEKNQDIMVTTTKNCSACAASYVYSGDSLQRGHWRSAHARRNNHRNQTKPSQIFLGLQIIQPETVFFLFPSHSPSLPPPPKKKYIANIPPPFPNQSHISM
jgi:hypothetical protein